MKKIIAFLLVAVMVFSFAACGGVEGGTETSANGNTENTGSNQETSGSQSTEPTTPTHEHTFEEGWTTDANYHWHKATCEHTDEVSDKAEHSFGTDRLCTVCGTKDLTPSVGLEFSLTVIGDSYYVTGIGSCTDADIVIPATYEEKPVIGIGSQAFVDCDGIVSVEILPDSIEIIDAFAFAKCANLKSVVIPDSVTSVDNWSFMFCPNLIQTEGYVQYVDRWVVGCDTAASEVSIRSNTVGISRNAFRRCIELKSVTIPDGVKSIGNWAFGDCTALTSVTMPVSLNRIGYGAFGNCTALASITFNGAYAQADAIPMDRQWNKGTGRYIVHCTDGDYAKSAFTQAGVLEYVLNDDGESYSVKASAVLEDTDIVIPSHYNGKPVTGICKEAFYYKEKIVSVVISEGVTSIGEDAFIACSSLKSITIPNSVTNIGDGAFHFCRSLENITIPNGVTSIGVSTFNYCEALTSIKIPDGVTSIGQSAFSRCVELLEIEIPDGITSIDDWMFTDCGKLANIVIPNSVTFIGAFAFTGCSGLRNITYKGTMEQWNAISRGLTTVALSNGGVVHCTDGDITK